MKCPIGLLLLLPLALFAMPACKPKAKEITPLQRKQAAAFESEAEFALHMKDLARAESLYLKAAELCPDNADYWLSVGVCRRKLDNRPGAKAAYESALDAYQAAYRLNAQDPQPLLQQIYLLTLLNRVDEARATLEKARKAHESDSRLRNFTNQTIDRMIADESFKSLKL